MAKRGNPQGDNPTENELEILKAVYWEPRIGLRIYDQVVVQTDNEVVLAPASLYTSLKRLHSLGWLEMLPEEEDGRKLYLATDLGRQKVNEMAEWMRWQVRQIEALQKKASRWDGAVHSVSRPLPVPPRPVHEEKQRDESIPLRPGRQT